MSDFLVLNRVGAVEMVSGEFPILRNMKAYSKYIGLCVDEGEVWQPEVLITD